MRRMRFLLKLQGWVCVVGLTVIVLGCLIMLTVVARAIG